MSSGSDAVRRIMEDAAKQAEMIRKAFANLQRAPATLPRTLPPPRLQTLKSRTMADTLYEDTKSFIEEAESKLEEGQQLVVVFTDRAGWPIKVSDLGYHNPNLMFVWGTDLDGNDCSVVVHLESFELRLTVEEAPVDIPRNPIGFVAPPAPQGSQ